MMRGLHSFGHGGGKPGGKEGGILTPRETKSRVQYPEKTWKREGNAFSFLMQSVLSSRKFSCPVPPEYSFFHVKGRTPGRK